MKKLIALLLLFVFVGVVGFAQEEGDAATETETQNDPEDFKQFIIDFTKIDPVDDQVLSKPYGEEFALSLPADEVEGIPPLNYGLSNWELSFISSIRIPEVLIESYVRGVQATGGEYEGQSVMGVKIKFPDYNFDMFADINPPFAADLSNPAFENNGFIDNVGEVKSVYMTVYGLYQPEKLYVVLEDEDGATFQYPMGNLLFLGWRELEWVNQNYVEDVTQRGVTGAPLYPRSSSKRLFKGIKVQRSAIYGTTDFVTYVKDVSMTYDRAVNNDILQDFGHEATWKILENSASKRNEVGLKRNVTKRYFEYLEGRKKYSSPQVNENNNAAAGGQ